jgi:hypothetical protein
MALEFEEPEFLVNDFLVDAQDELQEVLKEVKKRPKKWEHQAVFLKNFTNELFKASVMKKVENKETKQKLKVDLKKQLEEKKKQLMEKIKHLEFEKEVPLPRKTEGDKKDLIISKLSNKVVAFRTLGDIYTVNEPTLVPEEMNFVLELKNSLSKPEYVDDELIKSKIEAKFPESIDNIRYYLMRDNVAFGKVSPFLEDEGVVNIVCEGPNAALLVDIKNKHGIKTNVMYLEDGLNRQIHILARAAGKELSTASPFLDGDLNDKFSVQGNIGSEFSKPRFIIKRK